MNEDRRIIQFVEDKSGRTNSSGRIIENEIDHLMNIRTPHSPRSSEIQTFAEEPYEEVKLSEPKPAFKDRIEIASSKFKNARIEEMKQNEMTGFKNYKGFNEMSTNEREEGRFVMMNSKRKNKNVKQNELNNTKKKEGIKSLTEMKEIFGSNYAKPIHTKYSLEENKQKNNMRWLEVKKEGFHQELQPNHKLNLLRLTCDIISSLNQVKISYCFSKNGINDGVIGISAIISSVITLYLQFNQ